MSLGKKDISKNISTKAHFSLNDSEIFLNSFLKILKEKGRTNIIKISNFGTFEKKITPQRIVACVNALEGIDDPHVALSSALSLCDFILTNLKSDCDPVASLRVYNFANDVKNLLLPPQKEDDE